MVMKEHLWCGSDHVLRKGVHWITVPIVSAPEYEAPISGDKIRVVAFDGDDTLWHSETYFALTEDRFQALVAPWCASAEDAADRLLQRERENLRLFGYGIKGFTLSMIETAIEASDNTIPVSAVQEIIEWGKTMLSHPVDLLPGVHECLDILTERFRLLLITKGDLFHQESKVAESGIADRFESVHIVSEKDSGTYSSIVAGCDVQPGEFLMVGNSVVSDVQPVLAIGGQAMHIPYAVTWGHEIHQGDDATFTTLSSLAELPPLLL